MPIGSYTGSGELTVLPVKLEIEIYPDRAYPDERVSITVRKYVDTTLTPFKVYVQIWNQANNRWEWWFTLSSETGEATGMPIVPWEFGGVQTVCQTWRVRAYDTETGAVSNEVGLTIVAPSYIDLRIEPTNVVPGQVFKVSGWLVYLVGPNAGRTLAGATVYIRCPGLGIEDSAVTMHDPHGYFERSYTVPETASPGTYTITVEFQGLESIPGTALAIPVSIR